MAHLMFPKPPSRAQDKREKARQKLKDWREVRKRVLERDGHRCRVCQTREGVDVHHVRFRSVGGGNDPKNLMAACRVCHSEIHAYRLVVSGDANGRLKIERL